MALNKIIIQGRLTKDVELRYTKNEKPVASFTLAVDRDGKDAGTDFINCVAWNGTATFVNGYFHKGDAAIVSGRLQMRDWTDKDGNKRISAEVMADSVYFCGGKANGAQSEKQPQTATYTGMEDADGDLPF